MDQVAHLPSWFFFDRSCVFYYRSELDEKVGTVRFLGSSRNRSDGVQF